MEIESSQPPRRNSALTPQISASTTAPEYKNNENHHKIAQILKQLPPPQELTATVIKEAKALTPAQQAKLKVETQLYRVILKAGGLEFPANSPVALKKGQVLTLSMSAQNKLSIQNLNTANQHTLNEALKNLTPKQAHLASLLNALQHIHQFIPTNTAHTPQQTLQTQLKNASSELFSNLPQLSQLKQTGKMRQAVEQSGVFHENKLKQINHSPMPTTMSANKTHLKHQLDDHSRFFKAFTKKTPDLSQVVAKSKTPSLATDLKSLLKAFSNTLHEIEQNKPKAKQTTSNTEQNKAIVQPATENLKASKSIIKTLSGKINSSPHPPPNQREYSELKNATILTPEIILKQKKNLKPKANIEIGQANEKTSAALLKQVNASLARIQFNQVSTLSQQHNLSAETPSGNQWFFDLPINTGSRIDVTHVRIQDEEPEQNKESANKEKRWQVDLAFDLHELGKLHVELVLTGQVATSVLWVEHEQSYKIINPHINQLKRNLEDLGLTVENLLCRTGKPAINKSRISHQLIDITT